jgi:hypothetical protein
MDKELKRLVRAVEATQLEHEYEQTLTRAAAHPTGSEARALPPGAVEELVDVQDIVKLGARHRPLRPSCSAAARSACGEDEARRFGARPPPQRCVIAMFRYD